MPPIAPPQGYTDLAAVQCALPHSAVSVIGVVVDCLPPMKSSGTDSLITFRLQDTRLRDAMYPDKGLKVRYFSPTLEGLPSIKAKGDIVLLRNVRVSDYNNERLIISQRTHSSRQLVFSGSSVPAPALKLAYMTGTSKLPCHGNYDQKLLSYPEQDYIITMRSEMDIPVQPFDFAVPAQALAAPNRAAQPGPGNISAPTGPAGARPGKFKLVKDLEHRVFSDVCVEVVKKFTNNFGHCELYVTDYTENNQMFYYAPPEEKPSDLVHDGDRFGYIGPSKREWPGPYGYLVLKVNLTEPHASFAEQNVAEGDMIEMQNVKMKVMPNNSRLEGDMWPDQHSPSKVQVLKLRPGRKEIIDLCLRKEEYWASRRAKEEKQTAEAEPRQKKKHKKNKKQKKAEEARQKAEKEAAAAERKILSNPHVKCTFKDQLLTTISHILDPENSRHINALRSGKTYHLPFINARHHIKARVVDFYPPKLVDFAVQISPDDDENKSEYSMDMTWQESSPRWEWSFALQVEEVSARLAAAKNAPPPRRLWLNVNHMEAQHLLGNAVDDPADLREKTALLNQLREKLYILWGDLEERKRSEDGDGEQAAAKRAKLGEEQQQAEAQEQRPSNLPFNCCLQEYGVLREGGKPEEIADWERQYMMFGVTIN